MRRDIVGLRALISWLPGPDSMQESGGISGWTPRDIRRTVQTRMAEMGVRPDVVDRVLNHNVAGVRRHYDHYSYYPEIRKALIKWEQRLMEIVSGKQDRKVVSLR